MHNFGYLLAIPDLTLSNPVQPKNGSSCKSPTHIPKVEALSPWKRELLHVGAHKGLIETSNKEPARLWSSVGIQQEGFDFETIAHPPNGLLIAWKHPPGGHCPSSLARANVAGKDNVPNQ